MDKKKLKAMLLQDLASLLTNDGFEKRVVGQSIRRKTQDGRVSIHLSFIDHPEDFDVTADFGIRFNDVEDITNEIDSSILPILIKKGVTSTLGAELGNMSIGKQKRWTIENEEDVEIAVREIYLDLQSVFFPFIKKYATKEHVFELAIKDDKEANTFWITAYDRAKRAIVLAEILQKDDETRSDLIRKKEELLRSMENPHLDWFLDFAERFKR